MKNLILPLVCMLTLIGYSQSSSINDIEVKKEVKAERVDVTVTVDSLQELQDTFSMEDVKEMFDLTAEDKEVSFKIICNGEPMSNGKKSHLSYKVEGVSSDKGAFLERVDVIRQAAVNYYQNKK